MRSALNNSDDFSCAPENVPLFVEHLIEACDAKPTDQITVAGRRAIQTVVNLCQRDYRCVTCRTAAAGPHVGENDADSLWILNVPSESELISLVATLGHDLRKGGVLVVGFEAPISREHASRLSRVLQDAGLDSIRQDTDGAGRAQVICGNLNSCPHARAA